MYNDCILLENHINLIMYVYDFNIYCCIFLQLSSAVTLDPRPEYHRVNLKWLHGDHVPTATSTGGQRSSRMLSMKSANALLVLPPKSDEQTVLPAGAIVQAMIIGTL